MGNKALILHTVSDARHCVANDLHKGRLLFCTRSSVEVFFRETLSVQCRCLSSFFSDEGVFRLKDSASLAVDNIIDSLDKNISPVLNARYGLNMNYFRCLYSYYGKYQYMGYLILYEAIKRISKQFDLSEIVLYDYKFNVFIETDKSFSDIVSLHNNGVNTKVITYQGTVESGSGITLPNVLKRIRRRPLYVLEKLLRQLTAELHYRRFSKGRKTLLFYGHLYELDFLINSLNEYNIISYDYNGYVPVGFRPKEYVSDVSVDYSDFTDDIEGRTAKVVLSDLKYDFSTNISKYINAVLLLRDIQKKYPVSLGIWGNSPVTGVKAFIIEYLRSEGITILGAQHGCLFGDSYVPWHFDADLSRCTKFISYGFTEADLRRLYPLKGQHAEIVPLGKTKLPKLKMSGKRIDILFPITNSLSILEGGMDRTLPHKLTERQVDILNYLNGLQDFKTYIKPFRDSNYDNCPVIPILKKMNNLTVVYDMVLLEFFEKYHPAAIIMELPSQPLFEVLHMDSEIFLMNSELHPYEGQALYELKKRVHFAYDTGELISMFELYVSGKLEKKRDQTFSHHYVCKENTKENIFKLIHGLCESRG
ncbi:MAG: hypothetical protein HQK96_07310 [Nitrospirae bacterium]|nr:hypothetical protein [Nitrospirota bacterium]